MLVTGLVVFVALVAVQVRSIIRSPFPGLRAVEALAASVPLFLLLFTSIYVVMAAMSAGDFGGRLTHTDGLYFTVTVFSTGGFGDITAKIQEARLVVTGQMIADLIILGLAVKTIAGAVSRARQPADTSSAPPGQHPRLAATRSRAPFTGEDWHFSLSPFRVMPPWAAHDEDFTQAFGNRTGLAGHVAAGAGDRAAAGRQLTDRLAAESVQPPDRLAVPAGLPCDDRALTTRRQAPAMGRETAH